DTARILTWKVAESGDAVTRAQIDANFVRQWRSTDTGLREPVGGRMTIEGKDRRENSALSFGAVNERQLPRCLRNDLQVGDRWWIYWRGDNGHVDGDGVGRAATGSSNGNGRGRSHGRGGSRSDRQS